MKKSASSGRSVLTQDPDTTFADELQRGEISSFLDGSALIETPVMRNKLQRIAVEQSRLGIPLIFGHDVDPRFSHRFPDSAGAGVRVGAGIV